MQEEDIGTTPNQITSSPNEPSFSFTGNLETKHTPPTFGMRVATNRDPIPPGPIGWVMKFTKLKRVKHARIVFGIFIGILTLSTILIVAREYFISFVTTPIPKTIPLVKKIPIIE